MFGSIIIGISDVTLNKRFVAMTLHKGKHFASNKMLI